ncbi:MAG TPA: hypothetical protein VFO45_09590 [Sphingomicrobium sp.]|nr:hypothetical protein [Sphingomicrobium sp.]
MATVMDAGAHDGLSLGRVFDRAFSTIRHNPAVTLILALLFGTVPTLGSAYLSASLMEQSDAITTQLALVIVFSLVLGTLISAFTQGVLTRAVVADAEGRRPGLAECIRAAMLVLLPMTGLAILSSLAIGLGLALLIIPGLMMLIAWYVATPAMVEERLGIFAALQRSADLTEGARWPIFGLFLVMCITLLGQEWAVAAIGGDVDAADTAGLFGNPAYLAASAVLGTLVNVLWSTVQASLYVELRDWKDGPATNRLEQIFA